MTQIVRDLRSGFTPDRIHEEYPHLSLADIHAVLSFYYDHQADFDTRIEEENRFVAQMRANSKQPSREELVKRYREKFGREPGGTMSVNLYIDVL